MPCSTSALAIPGRRLGTYCGPRRGRRAGAGSRRSGARRPGSRPGRRDRASRSARRPRPARSWRRTRTRPPRRRRRCGEGGAASGGARARSNPPLASALITSPYWPGLVTTATLPWFLAAARTIAGPPMSICSMISGGGGAGRDRLLERVQVGDQELERRDAELRQLAFVVGVASVGQQPRVNPRVQRLDPAVEALGEAGEVLHLGDREARLLDGLGGGAGGDQLRAGRVQGGGQLDQGRLVVDGQQRPLDRNLQSLADPYLPVAIDGPPLAGHPADRAASSARSATLIRSCRLAPSSSSCTGTAAWASTGPASTPSSTRNTVQPVTLTP